MVNVEEIQAGGCWPTQLQKWLLQAALLDGNLAHEAWVKWSRNIDFENMDHASERLIPLLNHNLQQLKIEHPLSGRFQGLFRQSWVRSSLISQTGGEVLRGLSSAAIETLLLKGAAYSLLYYDSPALRPMADLDIMVPIEQAQNALDYLAENGWKVTTKNYIGLSEDYLRNHNGVALNQVGKCEVDLHWHALHECLAVDDDQIFWQSSTPFNAYGGHTKTLADADHLFHCCIHGVRWNSLSSIRWVADAHMIITRSSNLNWSLLVERADSKRLSLTLRKALHYLADNLHSPIPDFVLEALDSIDVKSDEEREHQIKTHPRRALGRLPSIIGLYNRQHQSHQNILIRLMSLVNYIRRYWRAEGDTNLVSAVVTKTARLLRTKTARLHRTKRPNRE